ncbi:MAG: preprotein translocase subunit SecG [Pseudomonadota bacterium]
MIAVILTLHVLIVLGLIGVVLLQRSEGGALGMGAGTGGGFMTGRGAANALTRTTSILAALFFATSLGLAIMAGTGEKDEDVIEDLTVQEDVAPAGSGITTTDDLLGVSRETDDASVETPSTDAPLSEAELLDSIEQDGEASADAILNESAPTEPEEISDGDNPQQP